ncbi:MAG: hypothetical protein AAF578_01370 [Pseudomonadota bacterium]
MPSTPLKCTRLVLVALLIISSHGRAAESNTVKDEVATWSISQIARDYPSKGTRQSLSMLDGAVSTSFVAERVTNLSVTEEGDVFEVLFDKGDTPARCSAYRNVSEVLSGTLLVGHSEITIARIADDFELESVEKELLGLTVDHINASPVMIVHWDLATSSPTATPFEGDLFVVVTTVGSTNIACAYFGDGDFRGFLAVLVNLVDNAKVQQERTQAFFEDLAITKVDGKAVGFTKATFSYREDGNISWESKTASFYSHESASLGAWDTSRKETSTPDGDLISSSDSSFINGSPLGILIMKQSETGNWEVDGFFGDENYELVFESKGPLQSQYGIIATARKGLAGNVAKNMNFEQFLFFEDSSDLTNVSIELFPDSLTATMETNSRLTAVDLAPDGTPTRMRSIGEEIERETTRVWSSGEMPEHH